MGKGSGAPAKFVKLLQVWLKKAFGKKFKNQGNILPHAVQDDGYSCAIITANTIAHAMLGRPLWCPTTAVAEHLTWFKHMAFSHTISMSVDHQKDNSQGNGMIKFRNRSVLAVSDLLNPNPPSPVSPSLDYPEYDSSSDGSQSDINIDDTSTIDILTTNQTESVFTDTTMDHDSLHKTSRLGANKSAMMEGEEQPVTSRKRSQSLVSSDTTESYSSSDSDVHVPKYVKPGEGTSRSAIASCRLKESFRNGTAKLNETKYRNWEQKVLAGDSDAEFSIKGDCWKVRHSVCGAWKPMREPYSLKRWTEHLKDCKKRMDKKPMKILKTPTLFNLGFTKGAKKEDTVVEPSRLEHLPTVPCPGITEADNVRVKQYLKRTGALGGGGRSLAVIAKEKFKKLFSKLANAKNKKIVLDTQMHEWRWRNEHENFRVFSTTCQKKVPAQSNAAKRLKPCSQCQSVLCSKAFKNAIHVPPPPDHHYSFINYRFRNKVLGSIFGRTIGVKHIIEDEV